MSDSPGPMYSATYERLSPEARSVTEARTVTSVVLFEGLEWIVESIRNHGYVMPEFPHPQLIKSLTRSPRTSRRSARVTGREPR